jgi:hypothetical protein
LDKSKKSEKYATDIHYKAWIAYMTIIAVTWILLTIPIIIGTSIASATTATEDSPTTATTSTEEPEQPENGGDEQGGDTTGDVPSEDTPGPTDVGPITDDVPPVETPLPEEPEPIGPLVLPNTTLQDSVRNETTTTGNETAAIIPLRPGPIPENPLCTVFPQYCNDTQTCPPNCLSVVAPPSDVQQGNIAAFESSNVTANGTTGTQVVVGTPEQIRSMALDKARTLTTNQTAIAEFENKLAIVENLQAASLDQMVTEIQNEFPPDGTDGGPAEFKVFIPTGCCGYYGQLTGITLECSFTIGFPSGVSLTCE